MQCPVCGMSYGVSHNCSGLAPILPAEKAPPVPRGIAPIYYLHLAFHIVPWDDLPSGALLTIPRPFYMAWFSASAIIFLVTDMRVFEEVDGIGRLEAFLVSAATNTIFLILLYTLPH